MLGAGHELPQGYSSNSSTRNWAGTGLFSLRITRRDPGLCGLRPGKSRIRSSPHPPVWRGITRHSEECGVNELLTPGGDTATSARVGPSSSDESNEQTAEVSVEVVEGPNETPPNSLWLRLKITCPSLVDTLDDVDDFLHYTVT